MINELISSFQLVNLHEFSNFETQYSFQWKISLSCSAQVSSEEAIEPEIRCWKNRAKHEHFLYYSGVDETAC